MGAKARAELSTRQAAELGLQVLDGQWVVAVLTALAVGPMAFGKLLTEINAVDDAVGRRTHSAPLSRQVLAPTLRRMAGNGLVVRVEEASPPRTVWYQLTPSGRELLRATRSLAEWAQRHHITPAET